MAKYGFPYMGSKSKIAEWIVNQIPSGKRLIDMFGGGGAITHCALESGKWDTVVYNELNHLAVDLFKRAINGEFNYDKFKPKFITRDEFFNLKETDGYVKYIWSFGNRGDTYLFNKDIEEYKSLLHNAIVFNNIEKINFIIPEFDSFPDNCISIKEKRLHLQKLIKNKLKNRTGELQQLERLERLQQLQQLQQLERLQQLEQLEQLEISNENYLNVEINQDDIIYCDPPYANTENYNNKSNFNHQEFWAWVRNNKNCVIVSEYSAPDDIMQIAEIQKTSLLNNSLKNKKVITEKLFWNGVGNLHQGKLF